MSCICQCQRTRLRRSGSNLTEVVIATLIVGLMLVPAMNSVGASMRSRTANAAMQDGRGLAEQLMTEVLQQPYEDQVLLGEAIGRELGESGTNRADWDDVDDYQGWNKSPPQDKQGNQLTNYSGWSRSVSVAWVVPASPANTSVTDQGLKRITVVATAPTGETTTLVALRSSVGAMEQEPVSSCPVTYQSWIGCDLQIGSSSGAKTTGGVNVINHAEAP